MRILALDTTSDTASIALLEDQTILASYTLTIPKKHSETLLPMIEHTLHICGVPLSEIDAFAVTVGPGSFTGVRIGVSMVKGLAFASDKPCYSVSTLEALAYNLLGLNGIIVAVMDARRNQFYNAVFRSDTNGLQRLTKDRTIDSASLLQELQLYQDQPIYFVGDGYTLAKKFYSDFSADTPPTLQKLNAASVGLVAYDQSQKKKIPHTDLSISPTYLRVSQAERERLEKEKTKEKTI